ncbi:MAG: ATP-binding protein [Bdellovibrionales bacterium]|nr:ATP-binding protein [Bdellovibrionales bacterium]
MSADLIKQLLRAYANNDSDLFRKSALQIAANESRIGHSKLAEELRELISKMPERSEMISEPINIAQPRGELAELIECTFPQEGFRNVVLGEENEATLKRIVLENRRRSTLQDFGVQATRRLLFFGPPGCGKTLTARVLAAELGLPLMTVRFDALFSKFLGATATHLRTIFNEMSRRPAVYFFDEFDAIGKHRSDAVDVGEVKRVVTSFLQMLDADRSQSPIIAATNFEDLIDRALLRRFDSVVSFPLPTKQQIQSLISTRFAQFEIGSAYLTKIGQQSVGLSFADIARACDDVIRNMALSNRNTPNQEDLKWAFDLLGERKVLLKPKRKR